ncbi:class I SAM-dependent methyltransferase [Nonomuraea sediminis]|uniref:class I SAM-dependent methyltransferase n=1 Tax=Nonomuraea sediminis TaxID=2835864 RepID=UPI001BDBE8D0|nr:class I SAM-dependent methyltransferase [Nonomuraea sediminis]
MSENPWFLGDLGKLAAHLPPVYAERLCEELDLRPGERVLDAAAGTGVVSVTAARRFCEVTAVDLVPAYLDQARELAAREGLPLAVRVADVQELPFDDGSFDAAVSTFGVMFAADPERAAGELRRVTRGRIGLTAWTPDGVIAEYARTIAKHLQASPPPRSPFAWGTEEGLRELFDGCDIRTAGRRQPFRYPSAAQAVDAFRQWYGPAKAAFAVLPEDRREAMREDMIGVWEAHNRSDDGTLVVDADYLEAVVEPL